MTETDAARWVERQPGLKLMVGKDRAITLTDGQTIEVTGRGMLAAVTKAQRVLRTMQAKEAEDNGV